MVAAAGFPSGGVSREWMGPGFERFAAVRLHSLTNRRRYGKQASGLNMVFFKNGFANTLVAGGASLQMHFS
jgi:hypothetical protein